MAKAPSIVKPLAICAVVSITGLCSALLAAESYYGDKFAHLEETGIAVQATTLPEYGRSVVGQNRGPTIKVAGRKFDCKWGGKPNPMVYYDPNKPKRCRAEDVLHSMSRSETNMMLYGVLMLFFGAIPIPIFVQYRRSVIAEWVEMGMEIED